MANLASGLQQAETAVDTDRNMRFDISAYKVGTSCGPSVIHKLDFDNPKVYSDTSIFDGLDKYWIGEADDSLKTRNLYHVIYEQAASTFNKISLFAGPCFSSYSNHPTTLQRGMNRTTGVTTASRNVATITC